MLLGKTEIFNGRVWKPIMDYVDGEEVLQFNLKSRTCEMSNVKYFMRLQESIPVLEFSDSVNLTISETGIFLCKSQDSYIPVELSTKYSRFKKGTLEDTKFSLVQNIPYTLGFNVSLCDIFKTALAVINQDTVRASKYNSISDNGIVGIKEDIAFTWCRESRRSFLSCLGISEKGVREDFTESLLMLHSSVLRQLEVLSQVSFSENTLHFDLESEKPSITLLDDVQVDLLTSVESNSGRNTYWVEPNSGWLVIRYMGRLFVVSSELF